MSHPTPSLHGKLQSQPLFQVLVQLLEQRASGTLIVEEPDKSKSAIHFALGAPMKARLPKHTEEAGALLRELGLIDAATENRGLPAPAKQGTDEIRAWHDAGLIDEAGRLAGQQELLVRQIVAASQQPGTSAWGFYAGLDFLEHWGEPEPRAAESLAVLWRLLQQYEPASRIVTAVEKLGDPELRLHRESQVARFGFVAKEKAVIDVLRAKSQRLSELVATRLASPEAIVRMVYAMFLTRHLDNGDGRRPLGVPESRRVTRSHETPANTAPIKVRARMPSSTGDSAPDSVHRPAAPSTAELDDFRADLSARMASLSGANYYEVLGVAKTTSPDDIQNAFLGLVKRWHPDRLKADLADLRSDVERLFARITEAHQTLMDDEQRKRYDVMIADGGGTVEEQEKIQAVIRAATAYQKAEIFLRKHSLGEAEAEAKRALDYDPGQADYVALYAWILAQKNPPTRPLPELIAMLDTAVVGSEKSVRNRFYRAQLLKRFGDDRRAIADFRWIVETNPHHVDARRELRIYEMRGSIPPNEMRTPIGGKGGARSKGGTQPKATAPNKGLFGRFFKR